MASGNRASMREGPLAQLFRKTEDEAGPEPQRKRPPLEPEPRAGHPLPEGGPAPQLTRQSPEPYFLGEDLSRPTPTVVFDATSL